MDKLDSGAPSAPQFFQPTGTLDNLTALIKGVVEMRDAQGVEYGADEVWDEIEQKYPNVVSGRAQQLMRAAGRRLTATYLRRCAGLDVEDDGPQIQLPGLERIPTHVSYQVVNEFGKGRVVTRHALAATITQRRAQQQLKHANTLRCVEREAVDERILDLLIAHECDSLQEYVDRYGQRAA